MDLKQFGIGKVQERMNNERSFLCHDCRHYRDCVSKDHYCPPYYLASLVFKLNSPGISKFKIWFDPTKEDIDRYNEYYDNEIKPMIGVGLTYCDFCRSCKSYFNKRVCPTVEGMKLEGPWLVDSRIKRKADREPQRICMAIAIVHDYVPCQVKTNEKRLVDNFAMEHS
jgi:hypothetical protein